MDRKATKDTKIKQVVVQSASGSIRLTFPNTLGGLRRLNASPEARLFLWNHAWETADAALSAYSEITEDLCMIAAKGIALRAIAAGLGRFEFVAKGFRDEFLVRLGTPVELRNALVRINASDLIVNKFALPSLLAEVSRYDTAKDPEKLKRMRLMFAASGRGGTIPDPDRDEAMRKIISLRRGTTRALGQKYGGRGQIESKVDDVVLREGDVDAQTALFRALETYAINNKDIETRTADAFSGRMRRYLRLGTEGNLIEDVRQRNPELTKEIRRELKANPPKGKLDRLNRIVEIKHRFYHLGAPKGATEHSRFRALDLQVDDKDDDATQDLTRTKEQAQYAYRETVEDEKHLYHGRTYDSAEQVDERRTLEAAIAKAKLSDRERVVAEFRLLEGKTDRQIAAVLKGRFGQPFTEANVRQLAKRANESITPMIVWFNLKLG